ncbi:NAD(P)-dependent oxidoreductase [Haladaptatus sp. F3-133]|uniref:NAD(P)-dependent oxidoreductase n=1 Tax=Halorutilus salinus TaxID=2487751 RepID=A0A9Q4C380_9EURY|nr:NAD(P)-dependent oxidoreductase [Halorutilus salinus]MCX2818628.1 NAD(P)-dependent oxidoreductase [Halorutilus salinus]
MVVVVTGGVGYIGSRLIREIPDHPRFSGETVRILDNFRQPRYHSLWNLPSYADYEFVEGDIRNEKVVETALEDADTVFHLAAVTNAPETFDIPEKTWEVNHKAAVDLFDASKEAGVENFVNAVTCSVYGRTEEKITEGFDCDPESPYGEAKLAAEQEMFERHDGSIELTGLRLGTVYGWTRGMRFDTVVDKFSLLAATGQPLTVYEGAEDQKRPYLHVQDAVRSMLFAAEQLGDGEAYNVVGQNARLQDVIDAIEHHFPNVEIGYTEAEQLNQLSYIVNDKKIRSEGFETAYTLDQGVEELADKFRAFV